MGRVKTGIKSKQKKSEKQLAAEKSNRILKGVAYWGAYYRENPQRFVKEYLNITLKLFQRFLIYAMMHNNHFMFWASRGLGKTWLTALFCVVRCILFPRTKICIASATRPQANEVLLKIVEDFCKNYSWGSDNLNREIEYSTIGAQKAVIQFRNGSWIKVVTASDTGRGNRANILICDEFRMVDKDTIDTVLKRFLSSPRMPGYLSQPEYRDNQDLLESNIEIFMSSAWFTSHWSYDKSKAYTVNMLGGRPGYFVCALPYQIAIKEGLLKRSDIEDEMSEADFDEVKFDMEMGCMPIGDDTGSFFTFDDISKRRKLQSAIYPYSLSKAAKIPELAFEERRILSVDIALMASKKKSRNDASSIVINSAIPSNSKYISNIIYSENHEGITTGELALIVRRLFKQYKCTDLVIDTNGNGLGVYDALITDIVDDETGELYPALSCKNDTVMAERCKVDNAPKVIWSIKASPTFNTKAYLLLRNAFLENKVNLLVSEFESEEILKDKIKGFNKLSSQEQLQYKNPYIQTTLLIYELINLQHERKGSEIRVFEKSGYRKDRCTSLAYNYWVQNELEREMLRKPKQEMTMEDFAVALRKFNKKPKMY